MKDSRAFKILAAIALATCIIMAIITINTCDQLNRMQWSMQKLERSLEEKLQREREEQASVNLALARELDKVNARISRLASLRKP